ncbi:MAG: hypothetical protein H0T76_02290 [Nannocystis sp.]|nr:hypothetical protein [Nannocystis sp.]
MLLVLAGTLVVGCVGCNQATGPLSLPAAVGRPAEASQGPRVGVIVTMGGGVTIVPSKGPAFKGLPDQQLLRDDSLVTAADSFVVVQLHNGHLVRLGASQRNVVEMLAAFHDPKAGDDVEARFVELLKPDERDDPALRGAITRVAGWNTRMNAAQTFAALPAPASTTVPPTAPQARTTAAEESTPAADPAPPPTSEQTRTGNGPSASDQPMTDEAPRHDAKQSRPRLELPGSPSPTPPPASRQAPEAKESPRAPEERKPTDDPLGGIGAESDDGVVGGGPAPSPESSSAPGPALPNKLKFTPASGGAAQLLDLPATLKSGGAALAQCAGAGAKISGRVKDHKLVELTVDGAKKCQALVGKANALADGSFELTVTP